MPFLRTAEASVLRPGFGLTAEQGLNRWSRIRTAAVRRKNGNVSVNLIDQASDLLGQPFDPSKYLLTHATIVASVDVYEPAGAKTGSVLEDGFRVNRRYADYRVKPGCDRFINNNLDAWARPVLLASYPTFIGAHNFVEHVQIEDLSKGRIIDAAARDIGDSVYVDILLATERKHRDLVAAIESGKMSTLSMGCTVDGTVCTRCGHWAADETEMCSHVKHAKGNVFFDRQGQRHRVAELCGHESIKPKGGVHFIEASWVATPAFAGAVLRNVLEPSPESTRRAQEVLSRPPRRWDADARRKAAVAYDSLVTGQWDDEDEEGDGEEAPAEGDSPLKTLEDELTTHMLDRVRKRVRQEMQQHEPQPPGPEESVSLNETLTKEGVRRVYQASLKTLVKTAASDAHLVDGVAALNQSIGIQVPVSVYRAVLKAGRYDPHEPRAFMRACHRALGRQPTMVEAKTMVRLGNILSQFQREAGD